MTEAGTEPEGSEELERSAALIEEAKGSAASATPDTIGDPALDSDAFPHPGDENDAAERF